MCVANAYVIVPANANSPRKLMWIVDETFIEHQFYAINFVNRRLLFLGIEAGYGNFWAIKCSQFNFGSTTYFCKYRISLYDAHVHVAISDNFIRAIVSARTNLLHVCFWCAWIGINIEITKINKQMLFITVSCDSQELRAYLDGWPK